MDSDRSKLNVGIIGTGKIGTDLLIKIFRSPHLQCTLFSGRSDSSKGIKKARELGIAFSYEGINAFQEINEYDLIFDATSAEDHRLHAPHLEQLGAKAIDMTPAKVGKFCIPAVNREIIFYNNNINMVTCGGQVAIPIVESLASVFPNIDKIDISSSLAADSIGPATWANIDDYYATTAQAITEFTGVNQVNVELNADNSANKPEMTTTIKVHLGNTKFDNVSQLVSQRIKEVQTYAPGYRLAEAPKLNDDCIEIQIKVRGQGDWVSEYAGNLDIINCAAISIAEEYALYKNTQHSSPFREFLSKAFKINRQKAKSDAA